METNRNERIHESMKSLVGRNKISVEAASAIFSLLFYNHNTKKKGYDYVYPIWAMYPDIQEGKCNDLSVTARTNQENLIITTDLFFN